MVSLGKDVIFGGKQQSTKVSETYSTLLQTASIEQESAPMRIRPSAFPLCSLLTLESRLASKYWDFRADMYTNIGKAVHETIQNWLPPEDTLALGDWFCKSCGILLPLSIESLCPECESPLTYQEIEVSYLGIKGHIDMVVLDKERQGFIITDFKTAGQTKVNKPTYKTHNFRYVLQLCSYAYMLDRSCGKQLKKKFGFGVSGASIFFISRDNPTKTREFYWTKEQALALGRKTLHTNLIAWRKAAAAHKLKKVNIAIKNKLCKSEQHYENEVKDFFFGGCPLANICILSNQPKDLTKHFSKLFKNDNKNKIEELKA